MSAATQLALWSSLWAVLAVVEYRKGWPYGAVWYWGAASTLGFALSIFVAAGFIA